MNWVTKWVITDLEWVAVRAQVTNVTRYYLSVDAMTRPMHVREDSQPYGGAHP